MQRLPPTSLTSATASCSGTGPRSMRSRPFSRMGCGRAPRPGDDWDPVRLGLGRRAAAAAAMQRGGSGCSGRVLLESKSCLIGGLSFGGLREPEGGVAAIAGPGKIVRSRANSRREVFGRSSVHRSRPQREEPAQKLPRVDSYAVVTKERRLHARRDLPRLPVHQESGLHRTRGDRGHVPRRGGPGLRTMGHGREST